LALNESGDVRPASAFKQITLPMTRQGTIVDLCWALPNGDGIDDLARSWTEPTAGPRMSKVMLTAELLDQGAF
jgi:hypothetical protein